MKQCSRVPESQEGQEDALRGNEYSGSRGLTGGQRGVDTGQRLDRKGQVSQFAW